MLSKRLLRGDGLGLKRLFFGHLLRAGLLLGVGMVSAGHIWAAWAQPVRFTISFTNLATPQTMGGVRSLPLAPGVWVLHVTPNPLFQANKRARPNGLEAMAEDGNPNPLLRAAAKTKGVQQTGELFKGTLLNQQTQRFTLSAMPWQRLSFATMFVESNDKFYAPKGQGIALFNPQGQPVAGDVTSHVFLWDAGVEKDEAPGEGANQLLRQGTPNQGAHQKNGRVRLVTGKDQAGFAYPSPAQHLRVEITFQHPKPPKVEKPASINPGPAHSQRTLNQLKNTLDAKKTSAKKTSAKKATSGAAKGAMKAKDSMPAKAMPKVPAPDEGPSKGPPQL